LVIIIKKLYYDARPTKYKKIQESKVEEVVSYLEGGRALGMK
jgi:hypothetical protein